MSAEQSRLRSAIQRIAKEDPELRGATDAAKSRGEQPGGTGVGESDGERDRICCDGSTSDNANPGTSTRDSEDGATGLDADDPARLDMGGGCLTGVTDCETGSPICFCGDDWIPPEGWEDAQSPATDASYTEGSYWSEGGGKKAATLTLLEAMFGDGYRVIDGSKCESGVVQCSGLAMEWEGAPAGSVYCVSCVSQNVCADGSTADYCNPLEEDIAKSEWPADGCVNLSQKGGFIVGSKYDPENDGSYSAPRKEIELCDGAARILVRAGTGSTWKSIQSLAGEPDGAVDYGYLYEASTGKRIRQISKSEFRDDTV